MRVMTYNILLNGTRGHKYLQDVMQDSHADIIVLQELKKEKTLRKFAQSLQMESYMVEQKWGNLRVGVMTSLPILSVETVYLGLRVGSAAVKLVVKTPKGNELTVFGVHLVAWYMWYTEWMRGRQVKGLLSYAADSASPYHILTGDFNTFAPGDRADLAKAPFRVKRQTWPQMGFIARWALRPIYRAGYTDCFRTLHPDDEGFTLPANDPQVRLDYVFANGALAPYLQTCSVVRDSHQAQVASDHAPVIADFDI